MLLDKYLATFVLISILLGLGIKIWADSLIDHIENSFSQYQAVQEALLEELKEKNVIVEIYVNGNQKNRFYLILHKEVSLSDFLERLNNEKKLKIKHNLEEVVEVNGLRKKGNLQWKLYLNDEKIQDKFNEIIVSPQDRITFKYQGE